MVLAHTQTASATSAWLALGVVLSVIVSGFGLVPPAARLLWIAGVATIAGLRAWGGVQTRLPRVATIGLACATVYMVAMVSGSRVAERQVTEWLAERGTVPVEIMAGPVPANPFARAIVVVDRQHYHFMEVNWLNADRIRISSPAIDRGPAGRVVEAALAAPHIQGITTWIRFPTYTVEELSDGYRVTIRDVRYARLGGTGLGDAVVESLLGDIPYPTFTLALSDSRLPGGHSPAYFVVLNQLIPMPGGAMLTWRTDPVAFNGHPSFFLAHELAHQWWGQAVGWKNYHEQWLSEGLAQYFAALHVQQQDGDEAFEDIRRAVSRQSGGPSTV